MTNSEIKPFTIAVSARSLFDLEESHRIWEEEGIQGYKDHIVANEGTPLRPGPAFPLVKALLRLNNLIEGKKRVIEIIMASGAHPNMGNWVIRSIEHHGLDIARSSFTSGGFILPYLKALGVDMLLSRNVADAQEAIDEGLAAAIMYDTSLTDTMLSEEGQIRIALDGDSVIFSPESEMIYQSEGLAAFQENEELKANEPMKAGPFAAFLQAIRDIQKLAGPDNNPLRIALFTARGGKAISRVFTTFRYWEVEIDEAHFLSGYKKAGMLAAFRPHIFFDDQHSHVGPAAELVPSGLVPIRRDVAA